MVGMAKMNRKKMCTNKVSFFTKEKAEKAAKRWGQRVYECPVCFCWHTTAREAWKDEFITLDKLNKILSQKEQEIRQKYEKKKAAYVSIIKALEEKLKQYENT